MRKSSFISILAAMVLVFLLLPMGVSADGSSITLGASSSSVTVGNTISVTAYARSIPNTASFGPIRVSFDPAMATYLGCDFPYGGFSVDDTQIGSEIQVTANDDSGSSFIPGGGSVLLFTLNFSTIATGSTSFSITHVEGFSDNTPTAYDVYPVDQTRTVSVVAPTPTPTPAPTATPAPTPTLGPTPTPEPSPTPAPAIQIQDKAGKLYTVIVAVDPAISPPAGFTEGAAIQISGQTVPNWRSGDGKILLIRMSNAGGKTDFYEYSESLNQVKLYEAPIVLTLPGRSFTVVVDPAQVALAGKMPTGFTETTAPIGGRSALAWKYKDARTSSAESGIYLVCLKDAAGLSGFYLFDAKTSDIMDFDTLQDHGLLVTSATTAISPSVTPQASPTPVPPAPGTGSASPALLVLVAVLAAICVSESAYIVWSIVERRKGKPRIRRI